MTRIMKYKFKCRYPYQVKYYVNHKTKHLFIKCTVFPFIVIHDPPQCEYVDTCMSLVYYQCQIEMYCLFFIVQSIYVGKLAIICFCKYMEKP